MTSVSSPVKTVYCIEDMYSHKKLNNLLKIPEVRFLISKMLKEDYIDTLINNHSTLKKNKEAYRVCAKIILENIDKRAKNTKGK